MNIKKIPIYIETRKTNTLIAPRYVLATINQKSTTPIEVSCNSNGTQLNLELGGFIHTISASAFAHALIKYGLMKGVKK